MCELIAYRNHMDSYAFIYIHYISLSFIYIQYHSITFRLHSTTIYYYHLLSFFDFIDNICLMRVACFCWPWEPFRSGNILMVLLPGTDGVRHVHVGLTLSCWVSVKKPKLATSPAAFNHLVCLRIVQMDRESETATVFTCNAQSRVWMLKPESVVAVLAPSSITEEAEMCKVTLSNESLELLRTERPGHIHHLFSFLGSIMFNMVQYGSIMFNYHQLISITLHSVAGSKMLKQCKKVFDFIKIPCESL